LGEGCGIDDTVVGYAPTGKINVTILSFVGHSICGETTQAMG
jgi:hypothetical protein